MMHDFKIKMVRTKDFNNKDQLLTWFLHHYSSLTFLRVESKDCTYSKFSIERKKRKAKIAEWAPTSFKQTNK